MSTSSNIRIFQIFSIANPLEKLEIRGLGQKEQEIIVSNITKSKAWSEANFGETDRRTTVPFAPEKIIKESDITTHFAPLINGTVRIFDAVNNRFLTQPVASIAVAPATVSKSKAGGTTQQFTATILPTGAAQSVAWSVTPAGAGVTISATGLVSITTGATNGVYTVTATSVDSPAKTATAALTVTA